MNKAMARHLLRTNNWDTSEILLAERIIRHDGTRHKASIIPTLKTFVSRQAESEQEAWHRLIAMLEKDEKLVDALLALIAL